MGELGDVKEYLRPPKGAHWDIALMMAFRVVSVIVETGECDWWVPLIEVGVSGPGPKLSDWFILCEVRPGIIDGLRELIDGGGVEK